MSEQNFRFYCDELCRTDVSFLSIKEKYGYPTFWKRNEGYVSLIQIILEQQVSLASAKAHFIKLQQNAISITPENLVGWSDDTFFKCQVSRQKASYIRDLSKAILEERLILESLSSMSDEEVISLLTAIKGIGKWTADIYLMFCLNRPDRFPVGDIALMHSLQQCFHLSTPESFSARIASWSPFRTIAAYFLWWEYLNRKNRVEI
ncbi:MAG: DNA-3-methyladenine glycosylase 2 family protein [Chitinophagales bacterium]|nr:DNA-3-methyladenine glycosylase 2 family protein [Chitinophagales bacterium]